MRRAIHSVISNPVFFCVALTSLLSLAGCSKTEVEPVSQAESAKNYTIGQKVGFGETGDSERFRISGWSNTEKEITWTEGPTAVLKFAGVPATAPHRLKMTLSALTNPPQLPSQPVEVYANGEKIATWEVTGKAEFTALIPPRKEGQDGALTIELRMPKAVSPKELGLNTDPRVLGVSVFDLTISKVG